MVPSARKKSRSTLRSKASPASISGPALSLVSPAWITSAQVSRAASLNINRSFSIRTSPACTNASTCWRACSGVNCRLSPNSPRLWGWTASLPAIINRCASPRICPNARRMASLSPAGVVFSGSFIAPILLAAACALQEPVTNQLAPQSGRIFMILFQDLIHLCFAIPYTRLKCRRNIA